MQQYLEKDAMKQRRNALQEPLLDENVDYIAQNAENITEDVDDLRYLEEAAEQDLEKYQRDRPKKWYILLIGLLLGGVIGFSAPKLIVMLSSARYYRDKLD